MSDVLHDRQGPVTILTLNRPQALNAITPASMAILGEMVRDFDADPGQRVLVLTGAGEKAFCTGADLSVMKGDLPKGEFVPLSPAPDMCNLGACKKPVIAAINGIAVGGGMELSMCCDIRLASDTAWFGLPEGKHGFIAGIAAVLLPRLLPLGVVLDMMLAGERLSAAEAKALGFVQKVLEPAALMPAAIEKAERMAKFSQPALWGTKQSVRFSHDMMRQEHHRYYETIAHRVLLAGDMHEGLKAFAEKRPPDFATSDWPNPLKTGA